MADGTSARIERALLRQLEEGTAAGVFPGASASLAYWHDGEWRFVDVVAGRLCEGGAEVTPQSFYDLASLTKPFVATTALRLYQAGRFPLEANVAALIEEAESHPIGARGWEEVLSHRSGLAAWEPFYEGLSEGSNADEARGEVLDELLPLWSEERVGTSVYSDLGYILVGIAMSRSAGAPLDELVRREVTAPLGIDASVFFGATQDDVGWARQCAPTGWSAWRQRALSAEVHDDNCAALGGVAGHAGMFGTARGVATFGASRVGAWHGRRGALEEEAIRFATAPREGGTHLLGWDGRADEGSSAGTRIGRDAFGHLGFTGTSLWCDPRRQLVIVLLTNRVVVPGDNAAIKAFRPTFHDALVDAFDGV